MNKTTLLCTVRKNENMNNSNSFVTDKDIDVSVYFLESPGQMVSVYEFKTKISGSNGV